MATQYRTRTRIDAPITTVWGVLADVERMPDWTPSIKKVTVLEGSGLAVGTSVEMRQPRMPAMTWTIDEVTPMRHFRWWARAGGVVTYADHWLEPRADGRKVEVRFAVRQTGPMAGLVGALTMRRTARYVDQEITGLKQASEAAVARDLR